MRGRRGFTLLETTVAIALLAVIIVTILGAFSAITIATRRHQQQTTLDLVTRQEAEFIKSQAYSATPKATPYTNIAVAATASPTRCSTTTRSQTSFPPAMPTTVFRNWC